MNIASSVLALAITCLVFELALSAPHSQVKDQLEDEDAKVTATDKLLNTLQLLFKGEKSHAATMALKQVLATKQEYQLGISSPQQSQVRGF